MFVMKEEAEYKVRNYIEANKLLDKKSRVVVALSGGPDSVALFHIMISLGYEIVAAHCNFHLRGEESNRDEKFVTTLCNERKVKLRIVHFDTSDYAMRNHLSIEMAARELRYRWFEKIRLEEMADVISVAHHADDVIETFFINLSRGTGIHGLTGIKPRNGSVVRPLLCLYREDITDYLEKRGDKYVVDSTNLEQVYLRNKFRHSVIPLMQEVNPKFKQNILSGIAHLADAEVIYNEVIEQRCVEYIGKDEKGKTVIRIAEMLGLTKADIILWEALQASYGFTCSQCTDMIEAARERASGKIWKSVKGYEALLDRGVLIMNKQETKTKDDKDTEFVIGNLNELLANKAVRAKVEDREVVKFNGGVKAAYFDADEVAYPLIVRGWRKGDRFLPFGMKGKKMKLSDFFVNQKLSIADKENVRIMEDSKGRIMWIVGMRQSDVARVDDKTKKVIVVSC